MCHWICDCGVEMLLLNQRLMAWLNHLNIMSYYKTWYGSMQWFNHINDECSCGHNYNRNDFMKNKCHNDHLIKMNGLCENCHPHRFQRIIRDFETSFWNVILDTYHNYQNHHVCTLSMESNDAQSKCSNHSPYANSLTHLVISSVSRRNSLWLILPKMDNFRLLINCPN